MCVCGGGVLLGYCSYSTTLKFMCTLENKYQYFKMSGHYIQLTSLCCLKDNTL